MKKPSFFVNLVSGVSALVLIAGTPQAFAFDTETASAAKTKPARLVSNDPSTLGFAFTYFWFDVYESAQDCPEGWAMALRDVAIMNLPKERQEFLLKPENRSTYYKMGYALSAKRMAETKGVSVCNIPTTYNDPPMRIVQGSIARGRDLDGLVSNGGDKASCGGVDFTSPDGTLGIDNQLYRVMGCVDSFRRDPEFAGGAMEDYHIGAYRDGEITTLFEIRGVDDRENDDEVEVGIYSSSEPTAFDSQKNGIANASLTVTDNKLWHNVAKGKIVDGELITDPFDLRLKFGWSGRPAEYLIYDTIIHMSLKEDGSAEGDLVGYFDLKHAYWHNFHDAAGALQVANGFTCPAVWKAMEENADGRPDPVSGRCTAISTAMKIEAVPAFVIHRPENELVKYVMDTRDYYGVTEEEIAVEGAELRAMPGKVGPRGRSEKQLKKEIANGDKN